jgi:hypothetical protein
MTSQREMIRTIDLVRFNRKQARANVKTAAIVPQPGTLVCFLRSRRRRDNTEGRECS